MFTEIKVITVTVLFIIVQSLELLPKAPEQSRNTDALSQFLTSIRRNAKLKDLEKVRGLYKKLTKGKQPREIKKWLRKDDDIAATSESPGDGLDNALQVDQQAELIEAELKNALKYKKSALLDRPYVEKQGKNDFLVLRPDIVDPFVTVIPNNIYYNIEKKCVNWLDDCSLKGIRARLLRGVQSPFQ